MCEYQFDAFAYRDQIIRWMAVAGHQMLYTLVGASFGAIMNICQRVDVSTSDMHSMK